MEQEDERAALTELRKTLGRDIDAWPPEHRHRYRTWEAGQLERKAAEVRAEAAATLQRAADIAACAAIAAEQARAAATEAPVSEQTDTPPAKRGGRRG